MTLVYLHTAMDLQRSNPGIYLPNNFPEGWMQNSNARNERDDDLLVEKSFELNLSTSRIQRSVADAFHRIGFEHVEEHIISMQDLSALHNINIPASEMEILSIDIANLDQKIAIEVDGPAHFISCIDVPKLSVGGTTKNVNGKVEYQFGWNGSSEETNGSTALKQRLLALLGWKVIRIPFWEWYAHGSDTNKEDDYCKNLLTNAMES
jgi:RAP domain